MLLLPELQFELRLVNPDTDRCGDPTDDRSDDGTGEAPGTEADQEQLDLNDPNQRRRHLVHMLLLIIILQHSSNI
ncbi:MAG: hypothetical protein WAS21_14220 [Geminicoccaceae bacterium]